jgi:hypothetical protein
MSRCRMSVWVEMDETGPCGKPTVNGSEFCAKHLALAQRDARDDMSECRLSIVRAIRAMVAAGLESELDDVERARRDAK